MASTSSAVTPQRPAGASSPGAPRTTSAGIYIVLLAQLMLVLDAAVMNVGLPHIATDLHFSPGGLSWVLNAYTLAFGGLLLLGGRLGDVLGRRRVFWTGLAVFTLASLAGGLAVSPAMLVISRALQGAGAAAAAPSVLALLTTSAPNELARNRALALFTAVSSGGAAMGLILGGILTDLLSWRWTMFINVPIGLFVLATVHRNVAETNRRPGRFDVVGALSASGAAALTVWTLIKAPDHGWGSWQTIGGFAVAAVLVVLLVATEARHPHPLLRLGLLRSHARTGSLITMAAMGAGMMAMFFLMVQFLEDDLGFGPLKAGLAFLPMPISIFTLSRVTPRLVARFGQPRLIAVGTTGLVLAFAWVTRLDAASGYWSGAFGALWLLGMSAGLTFMPVTSLVLKGVEPEHAGAASGLLQTMQQLGGAIGLAVIASVYAAHVVPGDLIAGLHAGFVAATVLAAVALTSGLSMAARHRALTA